MTIQNTIKTKTLMFSLIVLMASWVISYKFLSDQLDNSLDEQFQEITTATKNILDLEIQQEKKSLTYKLNEISNSNSFKKALFNKDYKKIKLIINSYYKRIHNSDKYLYNIIISSNNNKVIYGVIKGSKVTDAIKQTNKEQKPLDMFEVYDSLVTYNITKPILYDNKFIGCIELSINSKKIIKNLNLFLDVQTGIMIKNDKKLFNANDKLKYYFNKKDADNFKFYKINMQKILLKSKDKELAYFIVGYDMSNIIEKNNVFIYKMLIIGLFVSIIIAIVMYIGFTSLVNYTISQIFMDKLTELKNRDCLNNDLSLDENNIVILSNIKEFSLLNQYYGLEIANNVLKQVAIGFKEFASKHNMKVYRIAADEYVLLSNDNRLSVVECADILEELNIRISSMDIKVGINNETLKVEIYSGVSFNGKLPLEEAQIALREAKVKSLPYLAYAKNLDNKVDTKNILDIKKVIKYAIDKKKIIPFFQPITDRYGEFIKYEALVRILDVDEEGKEKIVCPDQFLPIAIRSGLYVDVAKEMLYQALTFFKDRDEKISVNFLPNDFYNHEIMDRFIGLVQMYKKPERVVVEITEQESVGDFDRLYKIVKKLRKLGVTIAIDDFGSGYANYIHVLKLKPDYLKIDGSLIKNILTDEDSQILVQSITRFAGYMKIKTVAEYVENEDIFELLKKYGVDEFQGYYFGRPLNLISGPNIF